jgi:hypothetical protein
MMVTTVRGNLEGYSRHEIEKAKEARRLQGMIGNPAEKELAGMVREKLIANCPVTVQLSWKCRRHVAACRHDMTCRSNFGQMGPCRRHDIEDVLAVCVGLSRHLPDFPICVCRNILWYGSTYTQILSHPHALNAHFMVLLLPPRSFIR